jgi:hypothetical protein
VKESKAKAKTEAKATKAAEEAVVKSASLAQKKDIEGHVDHAF